jgi:protein-tyrosine phosphatase
MRARYRLRVPALELVDEQAAFVGCLNFRDLGGHLTAMSCRIPARRLFRSDYISEAWKLGGDAPARSRLKTVIDLRSESELRRTEFVTSASVGLHVPLDNPQRGMTMEDWRNPHSVAERYLELLLNGADSVAEILAVLTDPASYPVAIHCSGGKDRAGIITALLLALLGVSDGAIMADYALSGFGAARLVIALQQRLRDRPDIIRRYLPALLSTHPDNIGLFLDRLREKFGSVEGYVSEIGMESAVGYFHAAILGNERIQAGRLR